MGQSQGVGCDGGLMPVHNALGIENWSHYVQDECRRVGENDTEKQFIPDEDVFVADICGEVIMNAWELFDEDGGLGARDLLILSSIGKGRQGRVIVQEEIEQDEIVCSFESSIGGEDHPLANRVDREEYYREVYPNLFYRPVVRPIARDNTFFGVSRQRAVKRTKCTRSEPNAKRKRIKYLSRRRDSIRTRHFRSLVAEAEEMAA